MYTKAANSRHTSVNALTHTERERGSSTNKHWTRWRRRRISLAVRADNLYAGAMSNDWPSEGSSYPSFALDATGLSPRPHPRPRPRQLRRRFGCESCALFTGVRVCVFHCMCVCVGGEEFAPIGSFNRTEFYVLPRLISADAAPNGIQ